MSDRTEAAVRAIGDYTVSDVLDAIRDESVSEVLSGAGTILALFGAAVAERMGVTPEGKAAVTIEIEDDVTITIKWDKR